MSKEIFRIRNRFIQYRLELLEQQTAIENKPNGER